MGGNIYKKILPLVLLVTLLIGCGVSDAVSAEDTDAGNETGTEAVAKSATDIAQGL